MKMRKFLSLFLLLPAATVLADTATDTFTVSATVLDSCIVSANNLSFDDYDPVAAGSISNTTTIDVTCTLDTPYNIGLNVGMGTGATVATRKMSDGSHFLNYSLFQDAGHNTVWGSTINTDTLADTGTGAVQSFTIYGQIFSGQTTVPSGAYSDTITVTITY